MDIEKIINNEEVQNDFTQFFFDMLKTGVDSLTMYKKTVEKMANDCNFRILFIFHSCNNIADEMIKTLEEQVKDHSTLARLLKEAIKEDPELVGILDELTGGEDE